MPRIQSGEDFWRLDNVNHAHSGQRKKPDYHNRAEPLADAGGASGLQRIQAYQNRYGKRHDIGFQYGRGDLQTLNR